MPNPVSVGGLVRATDYRDLFVTLESIRGIHYSRPGQTAAGRAALLATVPTDKPVAITKTEPNIVQTLKTQLQRFNASKYGSGNHGNSVIVPNVGTYLYKSTYDIGYNEVETLGNRPTTDATFNATNVSNYRAGNHTAFQTGNWSYDGGYDGSYDGSSYGDSSYSSNGSYGVGESGATSPHTNYNFSNYNSGGCTCTSSHGCTPNY